MTILYIVIGLGVVFYFFPKLLGLLNHKKPVVVEGVVVKFSGGAMDKMTVRVPEPVAAVYTYVKDEDNGIFEYYDYDAKTNSYVLRD